MKNSIPRIVFAGLSGGTGKTIVSLAVARALRRSGSTVAAFKKGPDYIDAKWLGLAAGGPCSNLDPYFHSSEIIRSIFFHKSRNADVSVIEGNRGLFDGVDEYGSCSTAQLARKLNAPVVLAIDCTKMTRTTAAIIKGCVEFEPGLSLAGVILNRTAGKRHRSVLRKSIETHTDVPVLGMLPKIASNPIPERHMGLMSDQEYDGATHLDALADLAEEWLDMDAILSAAEAAPDFGPVPDPLFPGKPVARQVRIGYVHDAALWFYYPENLEALEHAGAELVRLSLLSGEPWPDIDGLYLGGGFPEVFAAEIAANRAVLDHLRVLSESGLPIYAECGGFMVLCDTLEIDGAAHAMAGVFPVSTTFCPRPQGLGYTEAEVLLENPFFEFGSRIQGHEFHYSLCVSDAAPLVSNVLKMHRGKGNAIGHDGFLKDNTMAGYNHIHALAVPGWAERFVASATRRKNP